MVGASSVSKTLSAPSSGWSGWGSNGEIDGSGIGTETGTRTGTGTFIVNKGESADVCWDVTTSITVDVEGTAIGARTVEPFAGAMERGLIRSSTGRKAGLTSTPPLSLGKSVSMDSILGPLIILVLLLRKGKDALPESDAV